MLRRVVQHSHNTSLRFISSLSSFSSSIRSMSSSCSSASCATTSSSSSFTTPQYWHQPHASCGRYAGSSSQPSWSEAAREIDPEWKSRLGSTSGTAEKIDYQYLASDVDKIWRGIESEARGYERLETLCTNYPARISGSAILERAIDWAERTMREDGLENVRTEEVDVPQWVRGSAHCEVAILAENDDTKVERRIHVGVLSIGLSVGTVPLAEAREIEAKAAEKRTDGASSITTGPIDMKPEHILTAPLLVVSSFDDLNSRVAADANVARGKIVLFNCPFQTYAQNVPYRSLSAQRAEVVGAVGVLVRSVTPASLYTPHTGTMYEAAIPALCCTIEDAEVLQKLQTKGRKLRASMYSSAHTNKDTKSRNILAEIRGRELPNEFVVIGAHIDAWCVGQGAHDDGQGCMVAWDVVRMLLKLNLRPRRSIRVVLFTDEEVMSRGGDAYYATHKSELPNYQAVLETDLGAFTSTGFGFTGSPEARPIVEECMKLLKPYQADQLGTSGPGVDVRPMSNAGVPALLLWFSPEWSERDYFPFHHTHADTFDKIDPACMLQNTQVFAAMTYLLAEIPHRLPHAKPVVDEH